MLNPIHSTASPHAPTLVCMDSGVGGLAVLNRLLHHLPDSPYVFLGDTAWMPYGEKPLADIRQRVLAVHQWLEKRYSLAAFVLACNTATVATFDDLEAQKTNYPLFEPVKTTAQWVERHISTDKKLGILATPGTVSSQRYLEYLNPERPVLQIAGKGLASIIETGVASGPELDALLFPYLEPLQQFEADVVILGCTHYSLIQEAVSRYLGTHVQIVDSANIMAQEAIPVIQSLGLGSGEQQVLVTGDAQQFSTAIQSLPLDCIKTMPIHSISILSGHDQAEQCSIS